MSDTLVETNDVNLHLMSGKSRLHILKDINFKINVAEVVSIVGPSGSGKTSLLMVMAGLERATSGRVIVDGKNLSELDEDGLAVFRRHHIGVLFQNFNLIPSLTALENVSLALEVAETGLTFKQIRDTASEALAEVGLGDRLTHLPSSLSGGEQQRVGLARAIVTKPPLLLADEPTGNLDQDTGSMVIELMLNLARKHQTAMMLITHDPKMATKADRRLVMDHGVLTEQKVPEHA
ncbi:MAG: ABC transporter ATP-binding protein [Hyphomicrobiaceae bacterium]|nr:ABC transporter ATP-binding protein [Hyphomicrobiaceae bacterium]MCC0025320.1 ABC transporter ATP-binding protein [Hyphomicrobiaceae bacterium]